MAFNINNTGRSVKDVATSITYSQKPSCAVTFYRWKDNRKSQLLSQNLTNITSAISAINTITSLMDFLDGPMVVDNDVIRVSVVNNKAASSGTFNITLKRGLKEPSGGSVLATGSPVNYLQSLNPGDWVMLYMKKSGPVDPMSTKVTSGLKMIGIIDSVRFVETTDPNTSAPKLEYLITGRSFGKVLETSIYFNPAAQTLPLAQVLGLEFNKDSKDSISNVATKEPAAVIKRLVSFYFGGKEKITDLTNQVWYVPSSLFLTMRPGIALKGKPSVVDILATDRIGLHKYTTGIGSMGAIAGKLNLNVLDNSPKFSSAGPLLGQTLVKAIPPSGTVWSVLQYLSNPGINEMFVDLAAKGDNLVPALTVRQVPFSTKKSDKTNIYSLASAFGEDLVSDSQKTFFSDLPRYTINASRILAKNVGKSDFERINHIVVVPRVDIKGQDLAFATITNVPSVNRYGLNMYQVETSYAIDSVDNFNSYCKKCASLLADWFFVSHLLYNGTIVIDGTDEFVELGTNLFIEDIQQLFHIEGYSHIYEVDANTGAVNYSTEFRVSRGQKFDVTTSKLDFIEGDLGKPNIHSTVTSSVLENTRNKK